MGACFARAVERRSALLNQCFTFTSCAHARLLCVKPQEAELALHQQRAPLLHTSLARKKNNLSLHTASNFSQAAFLHILRQKCEQQFPHNWFAGMQKPFCWDLCMSTSNDKGELHSKVHPAACTYLSSGHIFTKRFGLDLITMLQGDCSSRVLVLHMRVENNILHFWYHRIWVGMQKSSRFTVTV